MLLLVPLWAAQAFLDTAATFGSMVVSAVVVISGPIHLVLLSPKVCHLDGRYLLLSSSLRADALIIQGFHNPSAVARPGSLL